MKFLALIAQTKLLKAEGHEIVLGKGKKPPMVKDFEKAIRN